MPGFDKYLSLFERDQAIHFSMDQTDTLLTGVGVAFFGLVLQANIFES